MGVNSCESSTIGHSATVRCTGANSCASATVHATYLSCFGDNSCTDGTYDGTEIACAGYESCAQGTFSGDIMTLEGLYAASGATLQNVGKIEAFGERSLENAIVGGSQGFDVYAYGQNAADG